MELADDGALGVDESVFVELKGEGDGCALEAVNEGAHDDEGVNAGADDGVYDFVDLAGGGLVAHVDDAGRFRGVCTTGAGDGGGLVDGGEDFAAGLGFGKTGFDGAAGDFVESLEDDGLGEGGEALVVEAAFEGVEFDAGGLELILDGVEAFLCAAAIEGAAEIGDADELLEVFAVEIEVVNLVFEVADFAFEVGSSGGEAEVLLADGGVVAAELGDAGGKAV